MMCAELVGLHESRPQVVICTAIKNLHLAGQTTLDVISGVVKENGVRDMRLRYTLGQSGDIGIKLL